MSVLILGAEEDDHSMHVLQELRRRRIDAHLLDGRMFPGRLPVWFDPVRAQGAVKMPASAEITFAEVTAVYWRVYHPVETLPLPDPEQSFLAHNEARSLFESLLIWLPARWVNGWSGWQLHQTKPAQLARVAALGVSTPETILTNDPAAVRRFAARVKRVVFKPVQGGAHARRLTTDLLEDAALQRLSIAPVTLQEEAPGTNIRAFVAGERVLCCEVRTSAIDFRDDPQPEIVVHRMPPEQEETCRRVARALDLVWTGIDFRLTPEGTYVYLEANPSPMFLGFEEQTRLPLTECLLDLLV